MSARQPCYRRPKICPNIGHTHTHTPQATDYRLTSQQARWKSALELFPLHRMSLSFLVLRTHRMFLHAQSGKISENNFKRQGTTPNKFNQMGTVRKNTAFPCLCGHIFHCWDPDWPASLCTATPRVLGKGGTRGRVAICPWPPSWPSAWAFLHDLALPGWKLYFLEGFPSAAEQRYHK